MARGEVHYEIFVRANPRAPWTLAEAMPDRDTAIRTAHGLLQETPSGSVKVTKETYDAESGSFHSIVIHDAGSNSGKMLDDKSQTEARDQQPLPCVEPTDLYNVHARRTMARVMESWLGRNKVTPFELLHRVDLVEKLEASGMELQAAIQKFAVAEAGSTKVPVQTIIKALHKLIAGAVERLFKDNRAKVFPDITPETYAATAEKLRSDGRGYYKLCGGIARYVGQGATWADKVDRILNLAETAPMDSEMRLFALQPLDVFLDEIVAGESGINELIGKRADLGASLTALTSLFIGPGSGPMDQDMVEDDPEVRERMLSVINRMSTHFLMGEFGSAHGGIARRILRELRGQKLLRPNNYRSEIQLIRTLAERLAMVTGAVLPAEDLQAAFIERSKRLLSSDTVERFLETAGDAGTELEYLFFIGENIVGTANKRTLSSYVRAHLGSPKVERFFLNSKDPLAPRLKTLARLQAVIDCCGFAPEDAAALHHAFGMLGDKIEQQEGLIETILRNTRSTSLERAIALLKLVANAHVPAGPAAERAKTAAKTLLRTDDARRLIVQDDVARKQLSALAASIGFAA